MTSGVASIGDQHAKLMLVDFQSETGSMSGNSWKNI